MPLSERIAAVRSAPLMPASESSLSWQMKTVLTPVSFGSRRSQSASRICTVTGETTGKPCCMSEMQSVTPSVMMTRSGRRSRTSSLNRMSFLTASDTWRLLLSLRTASFLYFAVSHWLFGVHGVWRPIRNTTWPRLQYGKTMRLAKNGIRPSCAVGRKAEDVASSFGVNPSLRRWLTTPGELWTAKPILRREIISSEIPYFWRNQASTSGFETSAWW